MISPVNCVSVAPMCSNATAAEQQKLGKCVNTFTRSFSVFEIAKNNREKRLIKKAMMTTTA